MDAFATAHRADASTHGDAKFAPVACAGPLLLAELAALERAVGQAARPLVAIVGGSKVATKLTILETLLDKIDKLHSRWRNRQHFSCGQWRQGRQIVMRDRYAGERERYWSAHARGADIALPVDVAVAHERLATVQGEGRWAAEVADNEIIPDIGPASVQRFVAILQSACTIIENGPLGVFEFDQFGEGTRPPLMRSRAARHFQSPVTATRCPRLKSTASRTGSPIFLPAAAHFLNTWKVIRCRRLRYKKSVPVTRHRTRLYEARPGQE